MKKETLLKGVLVLLVLIGGWAAPIKNEKVITNSLNTEQLSLELVSDEMELGIDQTFDAKDLILSGSYDKIDIPIIDTSTLGEKTITFTVKKGVSSLSKTVRVNVVDSQAPVITAGTRFYLEYGEKADVREYYKANDNADGSVPIEIIGSYDSNKPGNYKIQLRATDKSGNTTARDITVIVKEKPKEKVKKSNSTSEKSATRKKSSASYTGVNGYAAGWCTWWAASRRSEVGLGIPGNWGNAISWKSRSLSAGYSYSNKPTTYSIAYFPGINHVAFVEQVYSDGSVLISEMGWNYRQWGKNVRKLSASQAAKLGYIR